MDSGLPRALELLLRKHQVRLWMDDEGLFYVLVDDRCLAHQEPTVEDAVWAALEALVDN